MQITSAVNNYNEIQWVNILPSRYRGLDWDSQSLVVAVEGLTWMPGGISCLSVTDSDFKSSAPLETETCKKKNIATFLHMGRLQNPTAGSGWFLLF